MNALIIMDAAIKSVKLIPKAKIKWTAFVVSPEKIKIKETIKATIKEIVFGNFAL
ncbi:MAG: hypothetical protein N3G19_00935 [Candidatus Pacearchaeota archaeon]|nr:hypothetical protein [Candidatus Pacearchaeota archaeon]